MTKLGILVYQSLPLLIGNVGVFNHKERAFVQQLNREIKALDLDWEIRLDEAEGDIQVIETLNPQVLILKNGLQRQFYAGDFDKQRIYQLDALELATKETRKLMAFLKQH